MSGLSKEDVLERKDEIQKSLVKLGERFYRQINGGVFPWVEMRSRSTDNIFYSPELRQYVLGDKKVRRSSRVISHLRPFTQMVWAAYFVNELLKQRKTSTLRDVYYSAQAYDIFFKDQAESDDIITDLETVIEHSREAFNVFPEERSAVFGDLIIQYTVPGYENRQLNLSSHPDGMMIGPALTDARFIKTSADKVIVIEKGAMFTRFVEERVYEKFNAILIYTAGQAPRSTRYFIRRLNQELGLPVYIFTDADPWGMHIAMVIISGSANAAHLRELTTPDAKWAGVWASDIMRYKLPSEELKEIDLKRLRELRSDPRYKEKLWQREIETFSKIRKKCELEAFSRYGLTHIVDKYLPERLKEIGA
ncbi:MAG: DNA topoisomerase IV subunit A [Nitrososphaerota archaeon]|nr:DNA topoisomerase IV subunit A [Candidatus Bathyarchaeota archaeon]MDW8048134.1 DNA topoisomerase IV subunit A [Nitrososphaerota archaeon]